MSLAPIVLFVYNRPWHTRQTVEALKRNLLSAESELFVFSDAPKNRDAGKGVEEVREYIKSINGFKSLNIILREEHLGLARSIIAGVEEVVNRYGKVIVMEDDLVSAPYFINFMNKALFLYENEDEVAGVHGYTLPVKSSLPETFFLKDPGCLGWATWKRGWDIFEKDGAGLLKELKRCNRTREFDYNNTYPYTRMLEYQARKKKESWAILWYASVFLRNKLCLYPAQSFIQHIGSDGSGTNVSKTHVFDCELADRDIEINRIPVMENLEARTKIQDYFGSLKQPVLNRIKNNIKAMARYVGIKRFKGHKWLGDYKTWEEAKDASTGYDNPVIFKKVKDAALKVKNGQAVYERDSVLFERTEHSYPLLAALMRVAADKNGKLDILDFGGSLGSSYFQNKVFLESLKEVHWGIVEQKHFVECGKRYFEDDKLRFYESIEACLEEKSPDAILFSGSIQYIEKPYEVIKSIVDRNIEYVIFDRTSFNRHNKDKLVVQKVSPDVFNASYPCWLLDISRFKAIFEEKYRLIDEFMSLDTTANPNSPVFKGFIYKMR
ncbi:methyltransferase, TIGR04325 family [Candidatus Omnitrophota bacterium]